MCSQDSLRQILQETRSGIEDIFKERLENLILYGSYARGDADEWSDIDILVLVQGISKAELWKYDKKVNAVLSRIEKAWDYDILLSVHLVDSFTFHEYANHLPFYMNVIQEGIPFVRETIH